MGIFRDLIIRIKGDTKGFQRAVDESEKRTGRFGGAMEKLGGIIMAAGAALAGFVAFTKKAIDAYDQQAKAQTALTTALKGREDMMRRISVMAEEMQRKTLFGDEQTILAAARLAQNIGANEDAIKQLLPLIADFAQAKGKDMATTADLIGRTLASSTNLLGRYGLAIEGAAGSSERLTSITNELTRAFEGQAEAAALAGKGPLTQLFNAIGEIVEAYGKAIVKTDAWTIAITGLKRAAERIQEALRTAQDRGVSLGDTYTQIYKEQSKTYEEFAAKVGKKTKTLETQLMDLRYQLDNIDWGQRKKKNEIERNYEYIKSAISTLQTNLENISEVDFAPPVKQLGLIEQQILKISDLEKRIPTIFDRHELAAANDQLARMKNELDALQKLTLIQPEIFDKISIEPIKAIAPALLEVSNAAAIAKASMDEWAANWKPNVLEPVQATIEHMDYIIQDFLSGTIATFAEQLAGAIVTGDFEAALENILTAVADWAANFGKLLIAAGIASEAFMETLKTKPALAIAAGIALVAAAALVKGALAKNPMQGAGGGAAVGGGTPAQGAFLEGFRQLTPDLRVTVDGRIVASGGQLAVVLEDEARRRAR